MNSKNYKVYAENKNNKDNKTSYKMSLAHYKQILESIKEDNKEEKENNNVK